MKVIKDLLRPIIQPRSYLNLIIFTVLSILAFGFGLGIFITMVVGIASTFSLAFTVLFYKFSEVNIANIIIDTFPKALLVTVIGVILVAIFLHIINKIAELVSTYVHIKFGKQKVAKNSKRKKKK